MAARVGLLAVLLAALPGWRPARAFVINAVEHRATYVKNRTGFQNPYPPTDLRVERLSEQGENRAQDASIGMSRFQYIGCFQHPLSITTSALFGIYRDPNDCIKECRTQAIYSNISTYFLIVAVQNSDEQGRCGCALRSQITDFREENEGSNACTYRCRDYLNPNCGGFPDFWGLYMEYDSQSMSAQGAYDPWRYVWYSVVTIQEATIFGQYPPEGVMPERYYLNAVDTVTGNGRFEFQMRLTGGILYGLQYDIDSTRLVALFTYGIIGRLRADLDWQYQLATILINTTNQFRPYMQLSLQPISITVDRAAVSGEQLVGKQYMAYSGASAIFSKDTNCYVFTQAEYASAGSKNLMKDRVFIVRIPDGFIVREEPLDFKVAALYTNEMYGDLSAIGPRLDLRLGGGRQTYVYLGRVYRSPIESRTLVDWEYNPVNPTRLANTGVIGDWKLYPGVAASEHLFNQTAITYRLKTTDNPWGVFTITTVLIRPPYTLANWCLADKCQGTLQVETPYASIFNREPGIPLTLKAPAFITPARFNQDASTITVRWDRSTLQGARQIDRNGDFLPDEIDYTYQRSGDFDCGEIFNKGSVYKLGAYPLTTCQWQSNSELRIKLGLVNISVGEAIFILPDVLYSVPMDNQWSPASTGGVQIGLPDPLDFPVISPSGPSKIDQCTPVNLKVESSLDGGVAFWRWSWVPSRAGAPNPEDLANRQGFVFDPIKLQTIQDFLASATVNNNKTFTIPSSLLEPAAAYTIRVSLTSRWNLTTNLTFRLEKLAFPAPTVYIEGPAAIFKNRTESVQLRAIGQKSKCADAAQQLAYRWLVTGQREAPQTGVKLDFKDRPDILTTAPDLVIPPFVLEPTVDAPFNVYNFSVECYVNTEFGNVPERTARATVTVNVRQSPVLVKMTVYDRLLTVTDVLVLDARPSLDPDYPPASKGLTFQGTFDYRCLTPQPQRKPCFTKTRRLGDGLTAEEEADGWFRFTGEEVAAMGRQLQASNGFIPRTSMKPCRQDIGTLLYGGGQTYFQPLFDDMDFCQYARGVLMVQTTTFLVGVYKWTIRITHNDGRQASLDVNIEMVLQRVPQIVLSFVNPPTGGKFSVTQQIRIRGIEEGQISNVSRTYSWKVFVYEVNTDYNPQEAAARANDPANPYTVDQYTFADYTKVYDVSDKTRFEASPTSPNLVIKANALQASKTYKFRLLINVGAVQGYSDIGVVTAGEAPRNGQLQVTPRYGLFTVDRILNAPGWNADDSPLTYEFGYYDFSLGSDTPTLQDFATAPSQVKSLTVTSLPIGKKDPDSGNFTLPLFVKVCTPYQACSTETLIVGSNPPATPAEAVDHAQSLIDEAKTQDQSQSLNTFNSVLSAAGQNQSIQSQVLDGLESIPMSPRAADIGRQAALLSTLVDQGANTNVALGERVTSLLENLVIVAAGNNLFSENPAIAVNAFNAMGGLMPGANDLRSSTRASGQSTIMGRLRTPADASSTTSEDTGTDLLSDGAMRQRVNHPTPSDPWDVVEDCPTAFCDRPGLWCIPPFVDRSNVRVYKCCNARNPDSLCVEPPCWFKGNSCPDSAYAGGASSLSGSERRLQKAAEARRARRAGPSAAAAAARRTQQQVSAATLALSTSPAAFTPASVGSPIGQRLPQSPANMGGSWFDSWVGYNFPLSAPDESEVSEYNRVRGFHGWHPDIQQRRLEFMAVNESLSVSVRLRVLEDAEIPLVRQAQDAVLGDARDKRAKVDSDAQQEITFAAMSPVVASRLKDQLVAAHQASAQYNLESDRNNSQRITRIVVMRDTICKAIIASMVANEQPRSYKSITFRVTFGKTPDLTKVHPNFEFPAPYFKRPADSPDEPTALRPLTGFSYIYVEYFTNIYSWSDSTPLSPDSLLVTLIALQANTKDLEIRGVSPPIKLYKQFDLYSNAICLYWDRFAPNTAGGQWSAEGVVNDGDACLTTHLSDIAVFIDGRTPSGSMLVDAATSWEREVWESQCVGCGSGNNFFPVAVLGMMLFVVMLLILLGYVQDERRRSDLKRNKVKSRYYYDGDGLSTPLSVDDPIAYSMRDVSILWFWIGTFINVSVREHALLGVIFYHETFTRPQRLQCFLAMLCGLMAINAAVHSNPGYIQQAKEFFISGVLSGLLVFPVYCGLLLMFNLRPAQVKKRLIKRTYTTRELDLINDQRQRIANQTALLPPPGYLKTALPPPGSLPGQTTLLALPAPLPLPPLPPGQPGRPGVMMPGMFALPPLQGGYGATGMLALPGMAANMPLPPPPKYPPPPKNAKMPSPAALMPPLNWPKVGPPPTPFPALMAPDASVGGTYTNLPMLGQRPMTPPDTGATPLQLTDNLHAGPFAFGLPSTVPTADVEAVSPQRASLKEDMSHGMAPPYLPGAMDDHSMPEPSGRPGAFTPPGMQTPPLPRPPPLPGAGVGPLGNSPVNSQPSSARFGPLMKGPGPGTPPKLGASGGFGSGQLLPHNAVPPPIFIRGGPASTLPAPFPPLPAGPGGLQQWRPPGMAAPPGMGPPVPSAKLGGILVPGAPLPAGYPPAPPPPPREDDQAFVRRIKLTYMDKATREHDKHDLLEDMDELGKDIPFWVFDTMTLMPYLASCTFTLVAIFVVLQYGVKFQPWQEDLWVKGSLIGLGMILGLLEVFRIVMMTLVELRKFENRRKAKAGHFLPRRVKREGDDKFQQAPAPRLWKRAVVAPSVPRGKDAPSRPPFLPKADMPPPMPGRPPNPGPGPPPGLNRIPVAPPRPPVFSAAAMARVGALDEPPAPLTPQSFMSGTGPRTMGSGGLPGYATPPIGGLGMPSPNTPPGAARGPGPPGVGAFRPPGLQTAADLSRGGPPPGGGTPGRGGGVSPANSTRSLSSLAQSLNQQVKAGRHAEAPPPPPAQPGAMPAMARGAAPPPAPAAPPPSYSRPPSRPTSANSVPKQMPQRPQADV